MGPPAEHGTVGFFVRLRLKGTCEIGGDASSVLTISVNVWPERPAKDLRVVSKKGRDFHEAAIL